MVRFVSVVTVAFAFVAAGVVNAPIASADDVVTYEVVSASPEIGVLDVEYQELTGRKRILGVNLPWRIDAHVAEAKAQPPRGAQLRAIWREDVRLKSKWITVRIFHHNKLLCQSTLDVGNATCYGVTPHIS